MQAIHLRGGKKSSKEKNHSVWRHKAKEHKQPQITQLPAKERAFSSRLSNPYVVTIIPTGTLQLFLIHTLLANTVPILTYY